MPIVSRFSPWLNDRLNADLSFLSARAHAATTDEERAYLRHLNAGLRMMLEGAAAPAPTVPAPHARIPAHHRAYAILNPEGLDIRALARRLCRPVQTIAQLRSNHRVGILGFPPGARGRRRTQYAEHMEPAPVPDGPRVYPTHDQARERWATLQPTLDQPAGTRHLPRYFNM